MDLGLQGKLAVVLASSDGIGKGIAKILAQEGAKVVISGRSPEKLAQVSKEIQATHSIQADFYKPGETQRVIQEVQKRFGAIDILVTNNGGPPKGNFKDVKIEDWSRGFQGLWLSVVEGIQAVLPDMQKKQWGRILLVTSSASKEPIAKLTVSNGLRAGLNGLVNSLSKEVAEEGITINALLPGYVDTDRLKELGVGIDDIISKVPAKRLGKPEELGALAAFLCSEQAAYITGQALLIDGGRSAGI